MSALKQAKIYSRPRVELGKVIPLEAPFSIQIDICSACNLKCNFCFHSDLQAIANANCKFGVMSYELFVKIIDDIKKCWGEKKVKKLKLFKVGEPLLNHDVVKMVKYAKASGVAECVEITTNGVLLDKPMSDGLIEAGLDILNISVNGIDEKQYSQTCNYDINYLEFVNNIRYFYENKGECKLFVKYSDIGYTQEQKDAFYSCFEKICDEMYVETISSTLWQDTKISSVIENQHRGTYGQELHQKKVCPFIFTTMVISDKGIVHLCCVDWKTEYVLGDLNKDSIYSIWTGDKLRKYREMHLKMEKDNIDICKNCESLSANTVDDIDAYADVVLERMKV